jgi:hypothetical protein
MSIKDIEPRETEPTHSCEMLWEDFMSDFNLTTATLAGKLDASRQIVNDGRYQQINITIFVRACRGADGKVESSERSRSHQQETCVLFTI